MSGADNAGGDRYVVERGTDGSWLVVDRGAERQHRTAISREDDENSARQEARTMSGLDSVTSTLATPSTSPWSEIDQLIGEVTATVDVEDNYNHLLDQRP